MSLTVYFHVRYRPMDPRGRTEQWQVLSFPSHATLQTWCCIWYHDFEIHRFNNREWIPAIPCGRCAICRDAAYRVLTAGRA